jgi:hypothetical protein
MPDPPKGESLVDVHRSLPPEVQKYLSEKMTSAVHHALLENMRSMMPDERSDYARSLVPAPAQAHDILYPQSKKE